MISIVGVVRVKRWITVLDQESALDRVSFRADTTSGRELHKALNLALECVVAAESDLEARRLSSAGPEKSGALLGPPPPSITWLACKLCRELGAYRLEVSLIERWLEHLDTGQEQDCHGAAEQMKWRLATASELLRTGPRPAWCQDAKAKSRPPSGQEGH